MSLVICVTSLTRRGAAGGVGVEGAGSITTGLGRGTAIGGVKTPGRTKPPASTAPADRVGASTRISGAGPGGTRVGFLGGNGLNCRTVACETVA